MVWLRRGIKKKKKNSRGVVGAEKPVSFFGDRQGIPEEEEKKL